MVISSWGPIRVSDQNRKMQFEGLHRRDEGGHHIFNSVSLKRDVAEDACRLTEC